MDKDIRKANSVNGFMFGSSEDVELAKQELNSAKYIDNKISDKNAATILAIYRAALEKKIFRTPVGYSYMHELQKKLIKMGVSAEEIDPIPLFQVFNSKKVDDRPARVITVKKKREPYERNNAILIMINIFLVVLIIAMFFISYYGENANAINYRRAIENEYSSWKQELDERESNIREKERELNISYGYGEDTGG